MDTVTTATSSGDATIGTADHERTITELTGLLVKTVRALGGAGKPEEASRLSAKAWWVLQQQGFDRQAERINGTMHYLARLEDEKNAATD